MGRIIIGSTSDYLTGRVYETKVDGQDIILLNDNDKFYAIDGTCTHQGAKIYGGRIKGHRLVCPMHGACFDFTTGKVS